MTEKELDRLLSMTRIKPRMRQAIKRVMLEGMTQSFAAIQAGVSRQAVHRACERLNKVLTKVQG